MIINTLCLCCYGNRLGHYGIGSSLIFYLKPYKPDLQPTSKY